MRTFLILIQIVTALFLTGAILVQTKGKGFGRVWGSGATSFSRRGLEKLIFKLTFVVSGLFVAVSILQLFV